MQSKLQIGLSSSAVITALRVSGTARSVQSEEAESFTLLGIAALI